MKICFAGLGTMGLPMAQRLSDQGFDVAGWDILPEAGSGFTGRHATLSQAAKGADIIITMLPEGRHVLEVHQAVFDLDHQGRGLLIDSSTIDVTVAKTLARQAKERGYGFIDAPVSGGAEGARTGSLSFMLGGELADVKAAMPVFEAMGNKITRFGVAGAGQAAKACHNMICGITAIGVCEAFALSDALGLDQQKFFELCIGAAAQSWILENRCPVPGLAPNAPSSNDYTPGFAAKLMAKDLMLAQQAAEATGQKTPFGAEAARYFAEFSKDPETGALDFSAIYKTIKNQ